jgi:hypothetical protein
MTARIVMISVFQGTQVGRKRTGAQGISRIAGSGALGYLVV